MGWIIKMIKIKQLTLLKINPAKISFLAIFIQVESEEN